MTAGTRLTSLSHGAGCACKLSPQELRTVLELLGPVGGVPDPDLLVGYDTADDAAVYRLAPDLAVVFTADFFTPIVDDPYDWGRIAVANALSDVYAMGARPLMGLNLVAWPRHELGFDVLAEVLRGGRDVAAEAGAFVVGGHSIDDPEPKYGMAALGVVHPEAVVTNTGGRPGDALVLTKPIGLGAISTAIKRGRAGDDQVGAAVATMTTLNRAGAEVAARHGVRGGTDVTGFGLLGHLGELASASGCAAEVDGAAVPVIEGVRDLLAAGMVAGGTRRNHAFVSGFVDWGDLPELEQLLLADAQTSGGLLLAVPADRVDAVVADLDAAGALAAAVIGRLVDGPPGHLRVLPALRSGR